MKSLDEKAVQLGAGESFYLSETYFPDAHRDGKTLVDFTSGLWGALQNLRKSNYIKTNYLTMKCFMDTISYCLRKFGANAEDNRVYMPSVTEWEKSLIQSGYVSSQV